MAIYDEAVIDAQKLREVAENAAKQQILEAITPRIRQMINARILQEQEEEVAEPDEVADSEHVSEEIVTDELPVSTFAAAPAPASDKTSSVVIHNTGDIHIEAETEDEEPAIMTDQMAESLARMIRNEKKQRFLQKRVNDLHANCQLFKEAVGRLVKSGKISDRQKQKVRDTYRKLAQEAIALRGEVVANGGGSQRLDGKLVETLKEMKTMSNRTKRNIFDFLFEGDDEDKKQKMKHMDEAELTLSDEEVGELVGLDDEAAVKDAIGDFDLSVEVGGEDESEDKEAAGAEDEGDEADEADEGEEGDEDLDLGEAYEAAEHGGMEGGMEDTVYEIDESALRRELSKMKNLRESRNLQARKLREARARRAKMVRESAEEEADHFGGGEVLGDVFYDVDEGSLVNILADELGSVSSVKENRLRKAMKEAAEYKKAAETLKGQLVEMNLFNAKLLYANKLMQNKDLTVKQQRAIVEALDNAKTLREAKLLYKSLSESLARRAQKSGNLSENVNRTVLGSSSRSTRSAQPASSGVEVDRWAVLAGISGEK